MMGLICQKFKVVVWGRKKFKWVKFRSKVPNLPMWNIDITKIWSVEKMVFCRFWVNPPQLFGKFNICVRMKLKWIQIHLILQKCTFELTQNKKCMWEEFLAFLIFLEPLAGFKWSFWTFLRWFLEITYNSIKLYRFSTISEVMNIIRLRKTARKMKNASRTKFCNFQLYKISRCTCICSSINSNFFKSA